MPHLAPPSFLPAPIQPTPPQPRRQIPSPARWPRLPSYSGLTHTNGYVVTGNHTPGRPTPWVPSLKAAVYAASAARFLPAPTRVPRRALPCHQARPPRPQPPFRATPFHRPIVSFPSPLPFGTASTAPPLPNLWEATSSVGQQLHFFSTGPTSPTTYCGLTWPASPTSDPPTTVGRRGLQADGAPTRRLALLSSSSF